MHYKNNDALNSDMDIKKCKKYNVAKNAIKMYMLSK